MAQAKMIFLDNLPFKVKEQLVRERDFHQFSLTKTVAEARRHSNVTTFLNKGTRFQPSDNKPGNKPPFNKPGTKQQANFMQGMYEHCNMLIAEHVTNEVVGEDENVRLDDLANMVALSVRDGTSNKMERAVYLLVREKVSDNPALELTTRDASTATPRGRFTAKELLGETKRLLLRTGSGMSLLERLRRDAAFRQEM